MPPAKVAPAIAAGDRAFAISQSSPSHRRPRAHAPPLALLRALRTALHYSASVRRWGGSRSLSSLR